MFLAVYLDESSPDTSLRRSCSLSDLSMQQPVVRKNKMEQGKAQLFSTQRNVKNHLLGEVFAFFICFYKAEVGSV